MNKRIALLSSDEQTFKESTPIYQNALRHSYFDHEFTYTQDAPQRTRRNRQRNIIWFNPPFSTSVNTNIGREFLSLIDKHFPLQHKLHKIFNRNTLKVSSIITKHNAHIIRNSQSQNTETDNCNCDNKNTCPLPKQCMTNNIIYKATVTTNNTNDTKHYIGMTATTFKERYANHTSSFRHKKDSEQNETFETYLEIKRKQSGLYHQMVNFKTRYFVHRGIKTLQFMFGRKILHFERHKQRQFTQ